jgi:tetratricopeptide (TPR) repeat protein
MNSSAGEDELRRNYRDMAWKVEPVLEGLRANAESLQKYSSALTGSPVRYPPMEQALSCYRGMDIFPQEARLAAQEYAKENRALGEQAALWQTRFSEASRIENPAEAQSRFAGITQGISPALAEGNALIARYEGEPPRIAAEPRIAALSREARTLVRELETLRTKAGAGEESARAQVKELEERRAAALARELERLQAEARAQEEQARAQALEDEERRAKAIARELENMRAKALAEELARLRAQAQVQEELARTQALAEEELRAKALARELESLQAEAQAAAQAKARVQEAEAKAAKARAEELEKLRVEALAQEELARTKALEEEERRAKVLAQQLSELQAEAEAKARAQEIEKLRAEAQAQAELARVQSMAEEERRAQALARELEESRAAALARELEESRTKALARELEDLQAAIRARQALTPALIAQGETFKQEGDRFQQEARSALSQSNFERARDRVLRAGERYDASLAIQETDETRKARDVDLVALGVDINRLENQTVVREVRPLVTQARAAYEGGRFEEAEELLVRALSLWRRTNVEDDAEITYWLGIVRGALTLRAGRVIPVTAPLYAEMSQLLSEARKLYNDGAALLRGNKRGEGIVKFDEARRKTREVKLVFPVNQEANLLELRMDQVTNPASFAEDFRLRLSEAVAGAKRKDLASFAELQNLAEINPGYPGIQGMVVQAEIDLGYRPPPPDNRARDRAAELVASARAIIDRNDRPRFPAALTQLNQALVLNPANSQAAALKDRLQTSQSGGGGGGGAAPLVLSSAAEREYQRAVRELQQGNTLVARDIVQQLLADPRNRTTRLTDLQRRIASYL